MHSFLLLVCFLLEFSDGHWNMSSLYFVKNVLYIDRMKFHLRLNGDWMATEGWRERWFSVAFQYHLVTIQSTEWQAHFSDLSVIFFKIKLRPKFKSVLWTCFSKLSTVLITINYLSFKRIQCFKSYLLNTQSNLVSVIKYFL